jgi:GT2 family glycosyltransferase
VEGCGLQDKVSIVVLNWNGWRDTFLCLSSLRQLRYQNCEIIVVDNGSTDDSASRIHREFTSVKLIETEANLGFAGGCNVGIRYALTHDAQFVWLLNNDTTVDCNALSALVDTARRDRRIGAVGSAIYSMNEPEHVQAWGGGYVNFWIGRSRHFLEAVPDDRIEFITGASLLLPRQALESVGLLDEGFFMYWEDADFCFRLRRANWLIAVAGLSKVWHKQCASVGEKSARLDTYFNASAVRFFQKHAPIPLFSSWAGVTTRIAKRALIGDWKRVRAVLDGAARTRTMNEVCAPSVGSLETDKPRS